MTPACRRHPLDHGRAAAAARCGRDARADDARPARHRSDRRQAARRRESAAAGRICRPPRRAVSTTWWRLPRPSAPAVWDINNALEFPQQASALPQPGQGRAEAQSTWCSASMCATGKSRRTSSTATNAHARAAGAEPTAIGSRSASARSASANGRSTMAACSRVSVRALGDTALGIPQLTRICQERIAGDAALARRIASRKVTIGKRHDAGLGEMAGGGAPETGTPSPITIAAARARNLGRHQERGLGARPPTICKQQVRKLWDFDKPYRHPGVRARHLDPDRHFARRRARPQGRRPHRRRHPARRRPDVRCRRAVGRGEAPDSRC